jgi:type I restriction enzyme S subunit
MEWKEVRLGDVCNIITGFPFPGKKYSKEGIRVVRGDNVTIGNLRWDTEKDKRWNEPFDKTEYYSLQANDIVIGMDGSRVGKNKARIKEEDLPLLLAQRVACVRHNELAEQDYLYYNIFSKKFIDYVNSIHTGSAIPHISQKQIEDYKILLPNLETQRRIASILSSLDRKIELNNKINADLEEMAQAIFKNWFVDFEPFKDGKFVDSELGMIPEGWKVGTLGDITKNKSAKVKERNDVKVLSPVTTGELVLSEEYFTKQVFSSSIAKYKIVNKGDFAYNPARVNIGSLGRNEFDFDGCVSPVYVVFSVLDGYENYFDLFRKTDFFKDSVASLAIGGVRQSLSYDDLSSIEVIIPSENAVEEFNNLYNQMKKTIKANKLESSRLSSLRDTLLPRLMSGELEVPE